MKAQSEKRTVGPTHEEVRPALVDSVIPAEQQQALEKVMFPDFYVVTSRIATER